MPKTELVLIAAIAEASRVIGSQGALPWHLPEDLQRFKRLTQGHSVIMGRRTWESLPQPLLQRHNIIVSSQLKPHRQQVDSSTQVEVVQSLEAALHSASPRRFIIGGATLYSQTLPLADRLELTFVEGQYEGDTLFPPYQAALAHTFERTAIEPHQGFRFETYRRR
ncbi:MAG: dihydrofolate reductase [Cyanobacteria bacterium P01_A01_bin.135]